MGFVTAYLVISGLLVSIAYSMELARNAKPPRPVISPSHLASAMGLFLCAPAIFVVQIVRGNAAAKGGDDA